MRIRRKRGKPKLQRNPRRTFKLLQRANRLPRATSYSNLPVSLKPNHLQNRPLLPSLRPPQLLVILHPSQLPRRSPRHPLQPPRWPDVGLSSCTILGVCLLHMPVVIIDTTCLPFYHAFSGFHMDITLCWNLPLLFAT